MLCVQTSFHCFFRLPSDFLSPPSFLLFLSFFCRLVYIILLSLTLYKLFPVSRVTSGEISSLTKCLAIARDLASVSRILSIVKSSISFFPSARTTKLCDRSRRVYPESKLWYYINSENLLSNLKDQSRISR